jgi:hypothetical protein
MLIYNNPAILIRSLAMKVQKLEISRLNDINKDVVLEDIENLGKEIEGEIYGKFRDNKELYMFNENKDYFEECYERFIYLYHRKEFHLNLLKKI